MKLFFLSFFLISSFYTALAQTFFPIDKSPMDLVYLPDHFAHDRVTGQEAIIKVYYSRPNKNGRDIFGTKVPFDKVWRTGANEAVEFKAYRDITLAGKSLKAGTYSLFTIPGEKQWTIIMNSDLDYWGAYSYRKEKDVLRVSVPSAIIDATIEAFSIRFEDLGENQAVMRMAWDRTLVEVPITY